MNIYVSSFVELEFFNFRILKGIAWVELKGSLATVLRSNILKVIKLKRVLAGLPARM